MPQSATLPGLVSPGDHGDEHYWEYRTAASSSVHHLFDNNQLLVSTSADGGDEHATGFHLID